MRNARDAEFDGNFQKVKAFYAELRRELYKDVQQRYAQFIATPISYNDCITADSWRKIEAERRSDWFWMTEHPGHQRSFKRFDIAFKQGGKLVSLSYGEPTRHKTGLKIDLIESTSFKEDKLGVKAFEAISYAAQVYAAMLGADEIRIMKPTSPESRLHYCSFGYEYVSNSRKPLLPDYCVIKLR